jgi:hypothetical protein
MIRSLGSMTLFRKASHGLSRCNVSSIVAAAQPQTPPFFQLLSSSPFSSPATQPHLLFLREIHVEVPKDRGLIKGHLYQRLKSCLYLACPEPSTEQSLSRNARIELSHATCLRKKSHTGNTLLQLVHVTVGANDAIVLAQSDYSTDWQMSEYHRGAQNSIFPQFFVP